MNKKQRFLSAIDSNLSNKDNSVTPKICTVIIRGIWITSNTVSSTNKSSHPPKDFENDNFNSSKTTCPTKVADGGSNDCKKQPHTNHLFLALKLQGSKRIIRSQAFNVNPMIGREVKSPPKSIEENAYYHSQNDNYHSHLLEGQQEIPLNLKFCFEYNHYNKNNVSNVVTVGNNTSCNKLCIMLQRRKHYKSKALMGYKRLAVAFINLSQISERPFCGDVPMFNNAKALALWSKQQHQLTITLTSPEQHHHMSKQEYLLSTDIYGVISFERISCEDCMTSTSYDYYDGKDAVPLVHLANDNVYKNESLLVHENVSGADTGCISTDPAETDDELAENGSSIRTGRMVRTSHVNELLKKHQQIPGNLKKKLIWMLKKLKVSEEELDMITPALNEEMVCCATSDVNDSILDEKIHSNSEDNKVKVATAQSIAANKKWQIDASDLEKRLHKLLLRKRKSLKQHTLDFNSSNETDKQSNVKINDGYCFENDSFEAYPQDIVLLHKGERNDIESSIQQFQNDTTDVYSLNDEDLFNIDDLILGDDDSGEDSDEFGFNPHAHYGKRTDSKLVNKRRTYPINRNERNSYPYNMTNSPSKNNTDETYKTINYLTIRSDQEFPFPSQHLANTNRLSVNHSFRSNINSNRCDNGGKKYIYPTVSSSTSPLDSRQISSFYLHNAEDMKRMDEFSLNSVAYNRATKPYLKPFFNSTTNSITNTNHSSSTNTMTNRSHKSNTLPTISTNIINYINTAADNITVLPTIEKIPALSEPKQLQTISPGKDESNTSFLKRRSDLKSISQAFRKTTNLKFRKPNFRKDNIVDETKNEYQVIQSSTVSDDSNNKGSCCSSSETTNVNSSKKEDKRKLVKKPVMTFIKLQQSQTHYNGIQKHFDSNRDENNQESSEQLISKSLPKRMSQSYSCSLPIHQIDNNVSNNINMSSFLKHKANLIKRNKIVSRHRSAGVDSCKEDSSFKDTNTDSEMINNGSKKRLTLRLKQPLIKSRNGFKAFTVLSLDDDKNDDTTNLDGEKNGMVTSKNLRLRIPRLRKSSSNNNMLKKYPLNKTDNIHIPSNNSNGANVRKKRYNTAFCRNSFNSSFNDTLTKSNLSVSLLESLLEKQFNFEKYNRRDNISKISLFTHNLILIDKNLPCSNGLYEKCNKLDYPAILLTTEDIKHLLTYLIEKINEFKKIQPPFFHNCSRHHEFSNLEGPNTTQPTYLNPLSTHSINAPGDMGRGKPILNKSLKFLLTYVGSFRSLQLFIRLFADVFRDKDTALIEYLAFVFVPIPSQTPTTIDIVEDHLKLNSETYDQCYTSPIFADSVDARYHEYFLSNDWQMLQHGTKVHDDLSLQAIVNRIIGYISHVNGVERLDFGEILLTFNQKSVHRQMFVPFVKEARLILTPPPKSNHFHDNNTYNGNSIKACTPTDVMRVRSLLIPSRIQKGSNILYASKDPPPFNRCDSLAKEANSRLSHRRLNSLGDSRRIDLTDRTKDNLLESIKHPKMDILNPTFQPSKNNPETQKYRKEMTMNHHIHIDYWYFREDVMHINRLNPHSGNQKIFDFTTNYTRNAAYSDDLNPFRYTFVSPSNLNFSKLKDFSKKTVKNFHMIRDHNNVANNPLPIDIDDLANDGGNEKRYDTKADISTKKNKLVGTYFDGKNSSFTSQYILQKRSIKSGNRLKSLQITRDCNSKNNVSTIQNSNLLVLKMDLKGKKSKFKNLSSMKVTSGLKNQENQFFKNQCLKTKEDNTPNLNQNLCITKFEAHNVRRLVVCSTKTNTHPLKVLIDNVVWENVKFFQVTPQWQTHVKYIPIAMCSTSNPNNVDYS